MSERDRILAEYFAQHTVGKLLDALQNEEVIGHVTDKWAGQLQKTVGRTVIRMVLYVAGVALLISSLKAGLVDWMINSLTHKG
jgi:hypothetical protein